MSEQQIDRLHRVAAILALGTETVGGPARLRRWLAAPQADFGGLPPLEMLVLESGRQRVEEILYRISYGMA